MLAIHEGVLTDVVRHVLPADSLIQAVMPWEMVFAPGILGAFIMISAMGYTRLGARRPLLAAALTGLALWAASFVLEGAAKPFFIPRGLYRLEVGLEESAEMLGETLLLAAFASYALAAARRAITPLAVVPWRPLLGTAGGLVAVAVGIDPSYGRAHDNLGLALESRRDIAGAEAHFRLALGDRRVMADAHRYLGNLLERRGQLQEARQHWRQSLEADPHQHDAQA